MKTFLLILNRARRGLHYALLLVLFLLAQNVIFSHITFFGVHAMFLPALVVAVGLFEGGFRGGMFGLAAGALCDVLGGTHSVTLTVLFPLMGFVTGFLADFFLNRRLLTYSALAVLGLLVTAICQMFPLIAFQGQRPGPLWGAALLQTLWSVPFLFPAYYFCKMLPRRVGADVPSPY